ncbi:methylmalonyl Co-A mutase-associated GTPase MeaB [Dokdonia sinensis]|uniref:Methylmalonyl Co-A mutase-associated GTPase MeaB n=1 Tax=Dokdonia sinensis TaxID=2479847 RepID=A0A3M0GTD8_9FLAO|nr:methylmalonyl Co-A mutase-associated GTPase MeaB [Dokdonia sinensis]RMB60596.1 methylmalonyl Co-A mutase-associated GTPase MeaB [Dokdonia sinensis]
MSDKQNENTTSKGINPSFQSRKTRKGQVDAISLFHKLRQGSHTSLSRAITLVESTTFVDQQNAQELIKLCLPHAGNSMRIGITGVPGVGKSTFIEALGSYLTNKNHKVAVLAVDPSSSVSRGSILGDKTRMSRLSQDTNAFIRPSASGDSLGGVARKTREAIILCEAAGFDTILIETVGVGQSETIVHSMVDFFLLLKLAGAGDELQGIKRGIIEMADAIVINKADGENVKAAGVAKTAFAKALHLYPPKSSNWQPKVITCSALKETGVKETWQLIESYFRQTKKSGHFTEKRAGQNKFWLLQTIENQLKDDFYNNDSVKRELPEILEKVAQGKLSPFQAASDLLKIQ